MEDYNVITEFESYGKNMVVVRMNRAACVMERVQYDRIMKIEMQKRNTKVFLF